MKARRLLKVAGMLALAALVVSGGYSLYHGPAARAGVQSQATAQSDQANEESPQLKGSIFLGRDGEDIAGQEENEQVEAARLAEKAGISVDQVKAEALLDYPGAKVGQVQLGNENGYLVYELELQDKSGQQLEVKVDAGNGQILAAEKDAQDDEAEKDAKDDEAEKAGQEEDHDQIEEQVEVEE